MRARSSRASASPKNDENCGSGFCPRRVPPFSLSTAKQATTANGRRMVCCFGDFLPTGGPGGCRVVCFFGGPVRGRVVLFPLESSCTAHFSLGIQLHRTFYIGIPDVPHIGCHSQAAWQPGPLRGLVPGRQPPPEKVSVFSDFPLKRVREKKKKADDLGRSRVSREIRKHLLEILRLSALFPLNGYVSSGF